MSLPPEPELQDSSSFSSSLARKVPASPLAVASSPQSGRRTLDTLGMQRPCVRDMGAVKQQLESPEVRGDTVRCCRSTEARICCATAMMSDWRRRPHVTAPFFVSSSS